MVEIDIVTVMSIVAIVISIANILYIELIIKRKK